MTGAKDNRNNASFPFAGTVWKYIHILNG